MSLATIERLDQELGLMMDAQERLGWITSLGKRVEQLPDEMRNEQLLVEGCVSAVWLERKMDEDEALQLRVACDSPMVLGLVALLLRVAQGQKRAELPQELPKPLEVHGVLAQLTPNRRRGLEAVWQRIVSA